MSFHHVRLLLQVDRWYYELIEQLRKLLMTSVVVFFYPGSLAQLAGGIFVTFLGVILSFCLRPCVQPQLSQLQAACLCIQGVTLFCEQTRTCRTLALTNSHIRKTLGTRERDRQTDRTDKVRDRDRESQVSLFRLGTQMTPPE